MKSDRATAQTPEELVLDLQGSVLAAGAGLLIGILPGHRSRPSIAAALPRWQTPSN